MEVGIKNFYPGNSLGTFAFFTDSGLLYSQEFWWMKKTKNDDPFKYETWRKFASLRTSSKGQIGSSITVSVKQFQNKSSVRISWILTAFARSYSWPLLFTTHSHSIIKYHKQSMKKYWFYPTKNKLVHLTATEGWETRTETGYFLAILETMYASPVIRSNTFKLLDMV